MTVANRKRIPLLQQGGSFSSRHSAVAQVGKLELPGTSLLAGVAGAAGLPGRYRNRIASCFWVSFMGAAMVSWIAGFDDDRWNSGHKERWQPPNRPSTPRAEAAG